MHCISRYNSCLRLLKPISGNRGQLQPENFRFLSICVGEKGVPTLSNTFFSYNLRRRLYSDYKVNQAPSFLKRPTETRKPIDNSVSSAAAALFANRKKMADKITADSIVWIDCEMSGLDITQDTIMEIACLITGPNLDIIARHPPLIIKTPENILNSMSTWCVQHHGQSGLTQSCRESNLTVEDAERRLLEFVSANVSPGTSPLGGNSVHMDRIFLAKYMPRLCNYLHYRNVDVSTIKEVARRWFPEEFNNAPRKRFEHRTLADIEDSIEELKYYRSAIFKTPQTPQS